MKWLIVGLLLLTGCATVKVVPLNTSMDYTKTTHVDVYTTNKPTQNYYELAELTSNSSDKAWNMEHIIDKAKELGADAVIVTGSVGVVGGYNGYSVATEEYGIKAIAIKYK